MGWFNRHPKCLTGRVRTMRKGRYDEARYTGLRIMRLSGNTDATLLLTPQVGTASETKTHTTTLKPFAFGRKIKLVRIFALVDTTYTGAGNNLSLDLYDGTTSKGNLALTSEAANAVATSSDINEEIANDGYCRIIAKAVTTQSDESPAIVKLFAEYQEMYE